MCFAKADTSKLELYIHPRCPYCAKVTQFMKRSGIEIKVIDVSSSKETWEGLRLRAGKRQVPCLFIDGKPMHESDAIVRWMRKHLLESK